MTAAQWERLKELFEAALERPMGERAVFVKHVSEYDLPLQAELERLLAHHELMGSFLEASPEPLAYSITPGVVLAGRFRVTRALGRGGMGEVYEALDQDLGEAVAVKILRPELAQDRASVARLVQEIQLARKVTHPNVCRLFDLNRDTREGLAILFLTMELLPGETLSDRLQEGSLPAEVALPIARQIASGLDAAHAAGVIHRDFKSANVILTPTVRGERAVITDFGLARNATPSPERALITASGWIMGTPAYMAPERMEGGDATPAADLYALGVVLHQMRTGSTHATGSGRLEAGWAEAIRACLERDPIRRPRSGADVIRKIEHRRDHAISRRAAMGIAILALLVALVWTGSRFYDQRRVVAAGSMVMLADFQNATGDSELDAVTEVVRNQLQQSGYFRLWDPAGLPAVLERMARPRDQRMTEEFMREAALREGVRWMVVGSLGPLGGEFVLNLRLEEISSVGPYARRSWSQTVHVAGKNAVHDAIHDAALWLRRRLGEAQPEIASHDRLPKETTSSSWEALASYAAAERFQQNGQSQRAVALLRQAITRDPQFALAQMRLGDILMSLRRQAEGLEAWRAALTESNRRRLTRREELRIQGMYGSDTWDFSAAEAAFAQMEIEYPQDYLASLYLADALGWQGRLEDALAHMLAAERKQPDSLPVHANLARTYLMLQRHPDLDRTISRIRALGSDAVADRFLAMKLFALGNYEGALDYFDREAKAPDAMERSRGYSNRAAILAELGRRPEACAVLDEGMRADDAAGLKENRAGKLIARAYLALRDNDTGSTRRYALDATLADRSPFSLMRAAILLAQASYSKDANKLADEAAMFAPHTRLTAFIQGRIRGEIALAGGDKDRALSAFRAAAVSDPPMRHREYLARVLALQGLTGEAISLLKVFVDKPDSIWQNVDYDFPGFITDSVLAYARIAAREGQLEEARRALAVYMSRRGNSPLSEVRGAKELAQRLYHP